MNLASFFEQLIDRPRADPEALVDTLGEVWARTIYLAPAGSATALPIEEEPSR
jgi:hypothetical protein